MVGRLKVVINDTVIEQMSGFNYVGCKVSDKLNEDMESNVVKYNNINGITKNQCKKMTKNVKQILNNVVAEPSIRPVALQLTFETLASPVAEPAVTYSSETWVSREGQRHPR
jgi:hypothetical protein